MNFAEGIMWGRFPMLYIKNNIKIVDDYGLVNSFSVVLLMYDR
jgi:hypothetical protein